jgi:tRNA-specific 2-thiouridylase
MKKTKAVALFSGGLDSILSVKLLLDQGIDMHLLTIIHPFFEFVKEGRKMAPWTFSKFFKIPLKVEYLGKEFIKLVKNPTHGYGKNLNPCIDCRILFLKKATQFMEELNAQFIVTGEVLGERPMTQNRRTMKLIEIESGLEGKIVRPLSAQLLEQTLPEREGRVNREKLLSIEGRSRKPQIQLAKMFGIENYPTPAGGCMLTDPVFSRKLDDAIRHEEDTVKDITLLKLGRHFRLPSGAKVIVGRNEKENSKIAILQRSTSYCFEVPGIPSPITLLREKKEESDIEKTASLCLRYSDSKSNDENVDCWKKVGERKSILVKKIGKQELENLRI